MDLFKRMLFSFCFVFPFFVKESNSVKAPQNLSLVRINTIRRKAPQAAGMDEFSKAQTKTNFLSVINKILSIEKRRDAFGKNSMDVHLEKGSLFREKNSKLNRELRRQKRGLRNRGKKAQRERVSKQRRKSTGSTQPSADPASSNPSDFENQRFPSLFRETMNGFSNSKTPKRAIMEIRVRIAGRSSSKRNQEQIKVLPFLVQNKQNGKVIIVARAKAKETRQAHASRSGSNRSRRIRPGSLIRRFEFLITHLLQKRRENVKNLTEMDSLSSGPSIWALPRLQLSLVCMRKRKIVSCSRSGVRLEESPRILFQPDSDK